MLNIRHIVYGKLIIDGFGDRSTHFEYTKMVWDLSIDIGNGSAKNAGTYDYTEYVPVEGGRNNPLRPDYEFVPDTENSTTGAAITFPAGAVNLSNGACYVPLAAVMELMGKIL